MVRPRAIYRVPSEKVCQEPGREAGLQEPAQPCATSVPTLLPNPKGILYPKRFPSYTLPGLGAQYYLNRLVKHCKNKAR